jgi:hypothetical protein
VETEGHFNNVDIEFHLSGARLPDVEELAAKGEDAIVVPAHHAKAADSQ